MNHTKTLTLILLTLLTATSGMATAQNRTEKRPRKLSTKKQLVIERQRADSLAALVEEYRRRESDWQTTEGVEATIPFELITGDIGLDGAEDRYLSRLTLRLDADCASTVALEVSYDGGGWEPVAAWQVSGQRKNFDQSFVPRRCSTLRLRLRGEGQITLRSLARTIASARGGILEQEV